MRKLGSEKDDERISRRNSKILVFVMLFLLVASTAGFAFSGGGGRKFRRKSGR